MERGDPLHEMEMSMGLLAWIGFDSAWTPFVVVAVLFIPVFRFAVWLKDRDDARRQGGDKRTNRGKAFEKLEGERWAGMAVAFILDDDEQFVTTIRRRTIHKACGDVPAKIRWYVFKDGGGHGQFSLVMDGAGIGYGWQAVGPSFLGRLPAHVLHEHAPFDTKEEALQAYERWKEAQPNVERDGVSGVLAKIMKEPERPTPFLAASPLNASKFFTIKASDLMKALVKPVVREAPATYPCPCIHRSRKCSNPIGHAGDHWHVEVGTWHNDQDPATYPKAPDKPDWKKAPRCPCRHNGYQCEKENGHEGKHVRQGGVSFQQEDPATYPKAPDTCADGGAKNRLSYGPIMVEITNEYGTFKVGDCVKVYGREGTIVQLSPEMASIQEKDGGRYPPALAYAYCAVKKVVPYQAGDPVEIGRGAFGTVITGMVQNGYLQVQSEAGLIASYNVIDLKPDFRCRKLIQTEGAQWKGLRCGGGRTHTGPCS